MKGKVQFFIFYLMKYKLIFLFFLLYLSKMGAIRASVIAPWLSASRSRPLPRAQLCLGARSCVGDDGRASPQPW